MKTKIYRWRVPVIQKVRYNTHPFCASVLIRSSDTGMIDDLLNEENAQLEALVSLWESPQSASNKNSAPVPPSTLPDSGSDDEEYDQLFLDLVNQEYSSQDQGILSAESGNMDTSSG
jgi:hypothetical protein